MSSDFFELPSRGRPENKDLRSTVPKESVLKVSKKFQSDGTIKKVYKAPRSEWVTKLIHLKGDNFSFEGRDYLPHVYNRKKPLLLKTGRQVEKSTTLSNMIVVNSVVKNYFNSLYVTPSQLQTRVFSNEKLVQALNSPLIKKYFRNTDCLDNVFDKALLNGSYMYLRYAFYTADRCLAKDTLISMKNNIRKSIQNIQVGDLVKSYDIGTNRICNKKVIGIQANGVKSLSRITLLNRSFNEYSFTHKHVTRGGIKETTELQIGDYFPVPVVGDDKLSEWLKNTCEWVPIVKVELCDSKETFDLEIEDTETFIANGIVTHNSRGVSADMLAVDEIQDILKDNIPVLQACIDHSPYAWEFYSGTPKTFENTIEVYWEESTQNEWLVPCLAHYPTYWNNLNMKNIGLDFLICDKCGKRIFPQQGNWYTMNAKGAIDGYHISQLMVPWKQGEEQWAKIVRNSQKQDPALFHNETLGESYDNAQKPITRKRLIECCETDQKAPWFKFNDYVTDTTRRMNLFAGVDWGTGLETAMQVQGKRKHVSYTVLHIGGYINNNIYAVIFAKKYRGKEANPDTMIDDIVRLILEFGCKYIGVDWGFGYGLNNQLFRKLGADRVVQYQYVANQKEKRKWDSLGYKMQLNRNLVMSELFLKLKRKKIRFPIFEQSRHFLTDIEAIYQDYSESNRTMKYDHLQTQPDDFFHSLLYGMQAADQFYGKA